MIDFKKLVLTESTPPSGQQIPGFFGTYDYVKSQLLGTIQTYFATFVWPPNAQEFFKDLKDCLLRTGYVGKFKEIIVKYDCLPLIDFYTIVAEQRRGQKSIGDYVPGVANADDVTLTQTDIEPFCVKFLNEFPKLAVRGGHPFMDYNPQSPIIKNLKRSLATDSLQVVGRLALDNYLKNSLLETIYGLLEARKKARDSTLKTPIAYSAQSFVDDMLLNPEKFSGGKDLVPSQFKSTYQDVTANQIIELADAIKQLYTNQANLLASQKNIGDIFTQNKIKTTLKDFLQNNIRNVKGQSGSFFVFTVEENNKIEELFNSTLPNGYNIENIKSLKTDESDKVIQLLSSFANYIRYQEPVNVLGVLQGISQAAKGLGSLGGPMMGSR